MIKYSYRKYSLSGWPNVTAMGGQLDRYMQSVRFVAYTDVYIKNIVISSFMSKVYQRLLLELAK